MIFVDTSFWIARFLPRDGRHGDAAASEASQRARLVTSTNTCSARRGRSSASVRDTGSRCPGSTRCWARSPVAVERVDDELEAEAWAWLRVHDERPYSFVDATSFALMRRKRITDALAFGGDFAAAGFNEAAPVALFPHGRYGHLAPTVIIM